MKPPFGHTVLLQLLILPSFFLQSFEAGSCYVALINQVLFYIVQAGL